MRVSDPPRLADLRLIGQGREAEIFAWGEGSILRLMRDPSADTWADQQAAAMTAAWEAGGPVPTPGARVDASPDTLGKETLDAIRGDTPVARLRFQPIKPRP